MAKPFRLPVRADLEGAVSYGAPQLDVPARLNVNENPFSVPTDLAIAMGEAVAAAAVELNRYPERDALTLRTELARYLGRESAADVDVDRVWAANGSNEVMHHIFLAFGGPGRRVVAFAPTYSMYPEYARDTFTEYITIPRNDDFTVDLVGAVDAIRRIRPSIVLIASPNNPTGTAIAIDDLTVILDAALEAEAMVVVDEAYAEFRREGVPSACVFLNEFPNLIVSRTMSKAFALAGARLGYAAAADARVVELLQVVRLPYHLSAVTQAVAITALRYADVLQAQVSLLRDERDAMAHWLVAAGFTVTPSDANFILFGKFEDRHRIWQGLLDRGVLIRETGPREWLRVSIGTPEENAMFRGALTDVTGMSPVGRA